jgi:antitoxin ParD1/3/4
MQSMNISLPEPLKQFVNGQIVRRYSSVSEYIRELIRADEKHKPKTGLALCFSKG